MACSREGFTSYTQNYNCSLFLRDIFSVRMYPFVSPISPHTLIIRHVALKCIVNNVPFTEYNVRDMPPSHMHACMLTHLKYGSWQYIAPVSLSAWLCVLQESWASRIFYLGWTIIFSSYSPERWASETTQPLTEKSHKKSSTSILGTNPFQRKHCRII
jgi:hypothetical protein